MAGPDREPEQRAPEAADLPSRLADDEFYRALGATARRRVLYVLANSEASTVDDLATILSGWTATTTGTMVGSDDRAEIALRLRHNHLPRLAEAGLVDYDPEAGTVQLAALHPRVTELVRDSIAASQAAAADRE